MEECALYNFRASLENFPDLGCTGVAYGVGENLQKDDLQGTCWLKSGVTLGSLNDTTRWSGYNGAVLLGI